MAKILIVEDDPVIRSAYQEVLTSEGHEVTETGSGSKALEVATSQNPPEIILLDILMPDMSGIDFLRRYRAEVKGPGALVVVMSNVATPEAIEEAKGLGVEKYLTKSAYTIKQMVQEINGVLGQGTDN